VSFVEGLHALLEDLGAAGHDIAVSFVESPQALLEFLEVVTKLTGENLVHGHGRSSVDILSGKVGGRFLRHSGGLGTASTLGGFLDHRLLLGLRGHRRKIIAGVWGGGTHLLHPSVSFVTKLLSSHRQVYVTYLGLRLSGLAASSGGSTRSLDRGRSGSWGGDRSGSGWGRHVGWNGFSLGDLHWLVTVDAPLLLGFTVSTGRVIVRHLGVRHCLNVSVVSRMLG
jgi:hypothetical protein